MYTRSTLLAIYLITSEISFGYATRLVQTTGTWFEIRPELNNKIPPDNFIERHTAEELNLCLFICLSKRHCVNVFFNSDKQECLFTEGETINGELAVEEGWICFGDMGEYS